MRRAMAGALAGAALLAVVAWALFPAAYREAGRWLVAEDEPRRAVAIAVLGGKMPFRAMEAAELYRAGYAKEIWLPGPDGAAEHDPIKRMGLGPADPELYLKIWEPLGVPRAALRVLNAEVVKNTRQEIALITQALRAAGGGRVMIVTSPAHTRRVRTLWRVGGGWWAGEAVVRYTRHEPRELRLDRWWEFTEERGIVQREWGGLADAWLGFPMLLAGR